jgi:hypothetical protein
MTMIRHTGNKKTIPTNISRERILSTRGYSKKNLMFVLFKLFCRARLY